MISSIGKMDAAYAACVFLSGLALTFAGLDSVSVNTGAGTFIGYKKDVVIDDKTVQISKFLGIPYAEPPVGDLRFRKSVPKAALQEPLVTNKYGSECVQVKLLPPDSATSEDCLYLNIYSPTPEKDETKMAVMVWIHGGGFFAGSANVYVADKLAATGGVVVVTINYRVSALGFLNVGDANAPGNYGLWDQHLAIKWVHDNIEAFGGDADRITIFGESAGSASVIYQGIYPGNKGLFQRILAQSGSVASPWASTKHAFEEAKELAEIVDCEKDNNKDMIDCLRNVPADIIETALNGNQLMRNPFPFTPSVDNDFVKVLPRNIFDLEMDVACEERSTLSSFDLLIGANYAEGATCISPFCGVQGDPNEFLPSRNDFEKSLVPICVGYGYGKDVSSLLNDLVIAEYTNWADPEDPYTIREQFVAMHGDQNFVAPMFATVDAYLNRSGNALFVYHFTTAPSKHILPMPPWVKKALHADDLMYVFGSRAAFESFGAGTDELKCWEKELSNNIMVMWSNFAKSGNPNKPRGITVDWPPYTTENHRYLEISEGIDQSSVKERLDEGRANLWNHLLPKVYKSILHSKRSMYDSTCEKPGGCDP